MAIQPILARRRLRGRIGLADDIAVINIALSIGRICRVIVRINHIAGADDRRHIGDGWGDDHTGVITPGIIVRIVGRHIAMPVAIIEI